MYQKKTLHNKSCELIYQYFGSGYDDNTLIHIWF